VEYLDNETDIMPKKIDNRESFKKSQTFDFKATSYKQYTPQIINSILDNS